MAKPGKDSTLRDYEQKWKAFVVFLQREKVRKVHYTHFINFLKELFDKGLKPGTVNKYRSAIKKPAWELFKIDTNDGDIDDLIRGMFQERPNIRSEDPQWNLNKVLSYSTRK